MNKRRNTFRLSVAAAGIFGIISFCNAAQAVEVLASNAGTMRIVMQHSGKTEMPAAVFNHEAHAASVKKSGGDCAVCHTALGKKDAKGMKPFSVVPSSIKGKNNLMEAWHATCLECHAKQDDAPGAASCRSCHDASAPAEKRVPVNFDKALHAAHIDSKYIEPVLPLGADDKTLGLKNCGACHSSIGPDGKNIYVKDTEDSSSFYKSDSADSRTLASIAHNTCVSCHVDVMVNGGPNARTLALPVNCADCHSAEGQAKFQGAAHAPRLFRGQPDVIVLGQKTPEEQRTQSFKPEAGIKAVPFDHKLHEDVANCSVCHGMKIEKDESGKPATLAGKGLTAFNAAHDAASAVSCVGCHSQTIAADKNCAGCHSALKFDVKDSCSVCHRGADEPAKAKDPHQFPVFGKSTKKIVEPIDPADVPEKVTIDVLAKEYQAVELPHRKIYQAMLDGMKNSKMAAVFHVDSVCKACHHNIPNDNIANPPSCASCHDKEVKAATVGQAPHLKAAYHQMCISCHDNMGIKPAAADCADCHAPVVAKDTNKNKREVR